MKRDFMTRRARELSAAGHWDELAAWMGKKDGDEPRFVSVLAPDTAREITAERAASRILDELQHHLGGHEPMLGMYLRSRVVRELSLIPNAMLSGVPSVFTPLISCGSQPQSRRNSSAGVSRRRPSLPRTRRWPMSRMPRSVARSRAESS